VTPRIIVTAPHPDSEITVTIYREGEPAVQVEQTALQALLVAQALIEKALRPLIADPDFRKRYHRG
jgi:hypothetical protein